MLQPRGPWTVILLTLLVTTGTRSESRPRDADRGRRDIPDVTTVLLVGGGRFQDKPEGLLSSTARTFVQEGTTTEYATQVLGTRLDHGRVYAQVLSTSSRVFFDGQDVSRKTTPSLPPYLADIVKPTLVFPVHQPLQTKEPDETFGYTRAGQVYHTQRNEPKTSKFARTGDVITVSAIKADLYRENDYQFVTKDNKYSSEEEKDNIPRNSKQPSVSESEEIENFLRARKMDVFNKRNVDKQEASETVLNDLKPAKVVRPLGELPTLTVRHDFSPSGFSTLDEEEGSQKKDYSSSRLRTGKALFRTGLHKPEVKKLDTVTYMGFADFTTTVGDTVIVFMPNTAVGRQSSALSQGRRVTTITGDATVPPAREQSSDSVRVVTSVKTFMSHSPGMVTRTVTGHSLSMQTALPTMVVLPESPPPPPSGNSRDQKGFDPVYVVQAVTEQQVPDEETKTTFLAREQELFAKAPERDTEAPIEIEYIQPSVNMDDVDISSQVYENTEPSSIQYDLTEIIEPSSVVYESSAVEPSEVVTEPYVSDVTEPELVETEEYRPTSTVPLESYRTAQTQLFPTGDAEYPTGLLKAIGGTEAINGTTTLFTSLVYGTNINDDYVQIIHSTSSIFYFIGETKVNLEVPKMIEPSTVVIHSFSTASPEYDVTTEPEVIDTTEDNSISTIPTESGAAVGITGGEKVGTTFQDDTLSTLPMLDSTTPEVEISNEVETGRKINGGSKDQVIVGNKEVLTQTTIKDLDQLPATTPRTEERPKESDVGTTIPEAIPTTPVEVAEEEVIISSGDFITRLVPTTVYKTFTYFTTFFLPSGDTTTTSVRSREVIESDISRVTRVVSASVKDAPKELFAPTKTSSVIEPTEVVATSPLPQEEDKPPQQVTPEEKPITPVSPTSTGDEEIELIYKTLYTTYTYFTTFFVDSTTSISSREEVITNVMTSTVGQDFFLQASDPAVAGLFARDDNLIASTEVITTVPTSVGVGRPTEKFFPDSGTNPDDDLFSSVIDSVDIANEMQATPSLDQDPSVVKTYYTTYTYFTTIFVDGETEVESRTEVYTNIVSPTGVLEPATNAILATDTPTLDSTIEVSPLDADKVFNVVEDTPALRVPKIEYSSTIIRDRNRIAANEIDDQNIISSKPVIGLDTLYKNSAKYESEYATISRGQNDQQNTTRPPTYSQDREESEVVIHSMSSSSGGSESFTFEPLDDQISSESNTEELHPSPTLLLQTSYTTFTYFTTIYKGSTSSDVVSRLETVTNVVTETISPQRTLVPSDTVVLDDSSLPITYFTTYTYWTTLYKEGNTVVTSREETVSNVVTPSLSISPSSTEEITPTPTAQLPEPTTYYTTFTYFTTSYIGNSTVLNSRLETVTNVVNGTDTLTDNDIQAGRAIGTSAPVQQLIEDSSSKTDTPVLSSTGLLSTVVSSVVENGTTTLFSTDVYGTYIDGLYAKVLESTTQVITPTPAPVSVNPMPTGVVSLNEGHIIDADGVSTIYFTTQAIGTFIDNLYAQVITSTTSVNVDTQRQSEILAASPSTESAGKTFKTGLVRLIEGTIVKGETTTFYESRVVGTVIDGRYAQIIESTSSFKVAVSPTSVPGVAEIAVTSTLSPDLTLTSTALPSTTPSAVVIESSISEDGLVTDKGSEEEEHEGDSEEDDDDDKNVSRGKGRVKSRISFSPPKKTFTPQIRPFSSRNRQPFNPSRRKAPTADSATTITRTKVTPTITATPAAKPGEGRGRFSGNRRTSSSYAGSSDVKPTSTSAGRKFSRGRSSTSPGSSYTSTRGRSSGRISPTTTAGPLGSSRRGGYRGSTSIRGSSVAVGRASSSPGYFAGRSSRFAIRPTQVNQRLSPTNAYTTPSIDETGEPDEFGTTLMTEETPHFTDEEFDTPTLPVSTTTEPSRRTNPLLRFRRPPLNRAAQASTTARPATTPARRSSSRSTNRATTTTTSKPTTRRPQSNRYSPLVNRQRPTNSLFPPRGLFKRPGQEEEEEEEEKNQNEEGNPEEQDGGNGEEDAQQGEGEEEDVEDNDYEGSERKEKKTSANRRVGPTNPVQIKPFVGFNRRARTKRQATRETTPRNNYSSRFRRPGASSNRKNNQPAVQERVDVEEEPKPVPDPPKSKSNGRYSGRSRSQSQQPNQPRVKPTAASATSSRSQFTLRENKDTTTATRSGFRRPSNSPSRRRANKNTEATTSVGRPKPPRLRTQQKETNTRSGGRQRYSNTNSNTNTNTRRNQNARSRYRTSENLDFDTYTFSQSTFDGTITVTHRIPTEVTIPVVNGKVTEYRNVVTASPSTEVLGPHQYSTAFGKDGNTLLMLTSEVTGTLPSGVTEVTQFILHETPTTSITFTPTTIRGRKTSFSHVVPSTVYDVEQVVNTIQPQVAANAPLANILLSQLLLGNLGGLQPNINPLLALNNAAAAPPPTPTTEFKTRATTYVTTVTKGTSTVIPLTFRGKEILTTIVDSSEEVITATEFITDTVVITPTATLPANNQLNSLLLPALLQAQLLGTPGMQTQPVNSNPLLAGFQQTNPQLLQQAQLFQDPQKNLSPENEEDLVLLEQEKPQSRRQGGRRRQKTSEETDRHSRESEAEISLQEETGQSSKEEEVVPAAKPHRKKNTRGERKPPDPPPAPPETSVVTLYVSGRRPGEFSTVVSTVTVGEESNIRKRDVTPPILPVEISEVPALGTSFPESDELVMSAMNDITLESSESETQSLESIVGDVSRHVSIDPSSSRNFVGKLSRTLSRNDDTSSTIDDLSILEDESDEESSESNTTNKATGHFLSNGVAELAPLMRKGATYSPRGPNTDTHQTNTDHIRQKRSTSNDDTDIAENSQKTRKRILIRVPIHRKKAGEENEKEFLSLSEAQQMDLVTDMELVKNKQASPLSLSDFGTKIKNDEMSQGKDHHRKRIIVTRRRKPVDAKTESPVFSTDTIPTVEEPKVTQSTARRRIIVTKKRPVPVTPSTTRRRIVVTKKRPVTPKDFEIVDDVTPTTVTEPTLNTDYLYKYSVLKRRKPIDSSSTKPSTSPPRFMSGNIPAAFLAHLDEDEETVPENEEEESTGGIKQDGYVAVQEDKLQPPEKELEDTSIPFNNESLPELHATIGVTETSSLPIPVEHEQISDVNDEENMTDRDSFRDVEVTSPTNVKRGREFDSPILYVKPFIERPFGQKSYKAIQQSRGRTPTTFTPITEATETIEESRPSSSTEGGIDYLETTQDVADTTLSADYTTNVPQDKIETTSGKADFLEPPTTTPALPSEGTTGMEISNQQDTTTVSEESNTDKPEEDTTTTTPEESVIVTTPESTYEGPRYIRPTRFSVTRRPSRTKASFQRRRTSSSSIDSSTTTSSSTKSYRFRKPTTTRGYGKSSRTKELDFIEPTTSSSVDVTTPSTELVDDTTPVVEELTTVPTPAIETQTSTEESAEDLATTPMLEIQSVKNDSEVQVVKDTINTQPIETDSTSSTPSMTQTEGNTTETKYYPVFTTSSEPQFITRVVTRTRQRTYTYIVTRVAGTEQQVTSTTEVKPHVTTVTITQPLPPDTMVATDDAAARGLNLSPNEARYNLATKVMSNGVELIVAGDKSTLPGEPEVLRILSSSSLRPTTLAPSTLTDHMMMLLPQDVTQTFLTTYTYMTTFLHGGSTVVSSREQVVSNVVTGTTSGPSEVHMASTVSNTISQTTDVVNTYFVTYTYYSTFTESGSTVVRSQVATSSEVLTDKVFLPPKQTSTTPPVSVTATQVTDRPLYVFATKTYLTTFTYFTTLLQDAGHDKTSTVIKSRTRVVQNVVTDVIPPSLLGSDYLLSVQSSLQAGTPIVAMTTMVGGQSMTITAMESVEDLSPTSTLSADQATPTATISSSMEEPNNIVTGSTIIFFDEDDLLETSTSNTPTPSLAIEVASDHSKTPTPALSVQSTSINNDAATVVYPVSSAEALTSALDTEAPSIITSILPTSTVTASGSTISAGEQVIMMTQPNGNVTMIPISDPANKKPDGDVSFGPGGSEIQVSDLLSLGSLGINGFNALGPVINAMAGLIQSNIQPEVHRRNDSRPPPEERPHPVYVPSAHEPIYIPVGGLAGEESQNYEGVVNLNGEKLGWKLQGDEDDTLYPDTEVRHRPQETAPVVIGRPTMEKPLLGDGIPISPGEVITANSDVIVGKPAIMGPRPPKINAPLGMKPPPLPSPGWNKPPLLDGNIRPSHAAEREPNPTWNKPRPTPVSEVNIRLPHGNEHDHRLPPPGWNKPNPTPLGEVHIRPQGSLGNEAGLPPPGWKKPNPTPLGEVHIRPQGSPGNEVGLPPPGWKKPNPIPLGEVHIRPQPSSGNNAGLPPPGWKKPNPIPLGEVHIRPQPSSGNNAGLPPAGWNKPHPTSLSEGNIRPQHVPEHDPGPFPIPETSADFVGFDKDPLSHHEHPGSHLSHPSTNSGHHNIIVGSVPGHHVVQPPNTDGGSFHSGEHESHTGQRHPAPPNELGLQQPNNHGPYILSNGIIHPTDADINVIHPDNHGHHISVGTRPLTFGPSEPSPLGHHEDIHIGSIGHNSSFSHNSNGIGSHHAVGIGNNVNIFYNHKPDNAPVNHRPVIASSADANQVTIGSESPGIDIVLHAGSLSKPSLGGVNGVIPVSEFETDIDEDTLIPHGIGTVLDVPKDTGTRMDPPAPVPTGINVDVTPGQGFNVEISPGHVHQHDIAEHNISPSGIVLDVPLAGRPHRPPRPNNYPGQHRRPMPRPTEFMTPPPPPPSHKPNHFSGPVIIPLNPNSPQIPRPRPEDLVITNHNDKDDQDDSEEIADLDDGEVIQASNSRPLRPGEIPHVDEKPVLRPRPTQPTNPRPLPTGFTHYRPSGAPEKPLPEVHRPNLSKIDNPTHHHNSQHKPSLPTQFEERPPVLESKPPVISTKPQSPMFEDRPMSHHHPSDIEFEMAEVDKPPKPPKPLLDLEPQANTPRPYLRPTHIDHNVDDSIVMGLSPPPPQIAVSTNSGIRFPGVDESTHRPVVNIGGQRRPVLPPRPKPRPPPPSQPPYKVDVTTTTSAPVTTDHRPRPPIYEIPGPSSIPINDEEQNKHSTPVPITTHRPHLRPRPRPPTTTPAGEEVLVIGKPVSTPLPPKEPPIRRPVPPSRPPTEIAPTSVRDSTIRTPVSTIRRPIIAPSSVRTTTARVPTSTSRVTPELYGSVSVIRDETKHRTPIVELVTTQKPRNTLDHSIIVSSGSKTVFADFDTKIPFANIHPSQTLSNEVLIHTSSPQKPIYSDADEETDNDEDDDLGTETKKNDLGVASSNDETVIYDPEEVVPTRYLTHTQTLTVTTTETTVLSSAGQKPSTLTVVLTKTHTSTIVDTVTETQTLLKPTSVVSTVTTTVSAATTTTQPSAIAPSSVPSTTPSSVASSTTTSMTSTTEQENESMFVVVNDQRPDSGDDASDVARHDEADGVNHAVLLGGVLVAVPPRHNGGATPTTAGSSCRPDCSPARNERCQRVEGHMQCVCRPGFARMFPDRPCKPTYTYSMRLALGRLGQETLRYEPALEDPGTARFQKLAEASRQGLDRMVMQSDLRDIFHGVTVSGFQPPPRQEGVVVNFFVQLSDNTDEARLKDVFRKSLRTSNYSLGGTPLYADKEQVIHLEAGDFDECENPKFHDCSENARCFNLRGTYTCSCKEGFADLSENKLFPGRVCSAELVGCEQCHYHGTCYSRGDDQLLCECFQWYAGENCHINLKVLLIALVTIGAILLALLLACILLTCLKRSRRNQQPRAPGFLRYRGPPRGTLDKRAMILDTSSEGSGDNIPPPIAYMTPTQQPVSTFSSKLKQQQSFSDQRDRSLTVMIPRAKYRPVPPTSPLLTMSTFGAEEKRAIAQEQKLLAMLEPNKKSQDTKSTPRKKPTGAKPQSGEQTAARKSSAPKRPPEEPPNEGLSCPPGALVSAGFEVSATVGKKGPADCDTVGALNTLASHGSNFTTLRTADSPKDVEKAEVESEPASGSGVQELTVSEARSYDETTIQAPTRHLHSNYGSKPSSRNLNNDEAHTMAERDVGSTFLMPQTHLYKPDRGSDISNFDSL